MIEPRANPFFVGHESAVAALHGAALSGRLHHGWLISGRPGIGKATLAYRFARWLLAGGRDADLGIDETSGPFRRVAGGTHPDLFIVERRVNEKTDKMQSEIVINTVQEASKFMRLTPAEGGWRVVLIDGAEDMNPNAANALLKVLEEPPVRSILLLVSAAPGRLLPTIRSRCRALAMAPLANSEMERALQHYAPDLAAEKRKRLIAFAEGSVGAALNLAADDGMVLAELVDEALAGPVAPGRAQCIADAVARSADGTDKYAMFMTLLRNGVATAVRDAAKAGQHSLGSRVTLWQEFGRMEREVINLELDRRAAVLVALNALNGS